jgi:hypothetical protein
MDVHRLDNLAELMHYRELLLSRSTVVSQELQAVTKEIELLLEQSPHASIEPAIIVAPLPDPKDFPSHPAS